jgi:hypothetical protein
MACAGLDRQGPIRADDEPTVDTADNYDDSGHPGMRLAAVDGG